jgi:hypothetical protein
VGGKGVGYHAIRQQTLSALAVFLLLGTFGIAWNKLSHGGLVCLLCGVYSIRLGGVRATEDTTSSVIHEDVPSQSNSVSAQPPLKGRGVVRDHLLELLGSYAHHQGFTSSTGTF